MKLPTKEDVIRIHFGLVADYASTPDPIDPPGPRDEGLVASACQRPFVSLGTSEKYPTLHAKLAALFHSLVKNHAFHNGNKRTGLVTLIIGLFDNDYVFTSQVDDELLYRLVVSVADGSFGVAEGRISVDAQVEGIAVWLRKRTFRQEVAVSEMKITDFLRSVEAAGGKVKPTNSGYTVFGPSGSVKIANSTPRYTGAIVRKTLRKLGLNESKTGISLGEFAMGVPGRQEQIRRFRSVLNRLAKE